MHAEGKQIPVTAQKRSTGPAGAPTAPTRCHAPLLIPELHQTTGKEWRLKGGM